LSRDTVLFLSATSLLGGAQVSLLSLLRSIDAERQVRCVLMTPSHGPLVDRLDVAAPSVERVPIPDRLAVSQLRLRTAVVGTSVLWLMRHHRRLLAIHANGDSELILLLPVLPLLALLHIPLVVWYHSRSLSPWTKRLAPLWRCFAKTIHWVPVSRTAESELTSADIVCDNSTIVGNPISMDDVMAPTRRVRGDTLVLGYLGFENPVKGFLLLPALMRSLTDVPVQLACVTKDWPPDRNSAEVNATLDELRALANVTFLSRDHDVRNIYAQIDALLVPALSESFCRIAAEAMLNHIPVVASDLPAVREVCGDDGALFFPAGDSNAAAACVRRLVGDQTLQEELAAIGVARAERFAPDYIALQLLTQYVGDEGLA
jgi:glycosyltransferase involved in cell wall biosynthesis